MLDDKTIATIERIEGRLKEIESVVNVLDQAIKSYLHWMGENGYAKRTREEHGRTLRQFKLFIKQKKCTFEEIFTHDTLSRFIRTILSIIKKPIELRTEC